MAKNTARKVTLAKQAIIGFLGLLAFGFVGLSFYYGTNLNNMGPAIDGEDYTLLDSPIKSQKRDGQEVIEYFSYRCIHCKNFEPFLEDWLADIPEGITFERQHVVFSTSDELFARAHLALKSDPGYLKLHRVLFSAIHDRQKHFNDLEDLITYLREYGIDEEEFRQSFNSPIVSRKLKNNRSRQSQSQLSATPSLLVLGKYVISMSNGQQRALDIASELIERERNPSTKS